MIEYPCGQKRKASEAKSVCEPGFRIKFCTCASDEPLGYPRWELWRPTKEPDGWGMHAVGEIMPPPLDHCLLTDRVLQDLNRPDAFDMDLSFCDGDMLVLHWRKNDQISFDFNGERWGDSWGAGLGGSQEAEPVAAGRLQRRWR